MSTNRSTVLTLNDVQLRILGTGVVTLLEMVDGGSAEKGSYEYDLRELLDEIRKAKSRLQEKYETQ